MSNEIRPLPELEVSIRSSVDKIVGNLPSDKRIALILHADAPNQRGGLKGAVLVNIGAGWSFAGYLEKRYSGELSGGAELRFLR